MCMTNKSKTSKKTGKKKLVPKPRLRRKLLTLWSEKCRSTVDYTCIICGAKQARNGEEIDGIKIVKKVDAHHIVGKEIHNSFFRFHLTNAACLCPSCHKFGNNSAHRNAVFFINFIQTNYPDRFAYLLKYNDIRIDLDNREVLAEIESKLKEGLPLDLDAIREIEKKAEAEAPKKPIDDFEGSLFDDIDNKTDITEDDDDEKDDEDSSSSENYLDLG